MNTIENAIRTYWQVQVDTQRARKDGGHYRAAEALYGMYSEDIACAAIYRVTQGIEA